MIPTARSLYDTVAHESAAVVIRRYSTSFRMATRLLGPEVRTHVRSIYALVRVADEIVDGVAAGSGLAATDVLAALDAFEAETENAMATGYSTNLIIHAFALSARYAGIDTALTRPFFASMRADCTRAEHDDASFERYVFGSAEVVGLMCLRVFLAERTLSTAERDRLEAGGQRLGAAFQKVNFLRDMAADEADLGRHYFPGADLASLTDATKARLVADVRADLDASARVIPDLPRSSRRAVALAQFLFADLTDRIDAIPAHRLARERVSVPAPRKLVLAVRAIAGATPKPRDTRAQAASGGRA